jgi:hypothetical protein
MRRWWRFWDKPKPMWLTPEAIQAIMPKNSRSMIVRFGEADQPDHFYWQLRRHDRVKDLAIRALQLQDRDMTLPLKACDVQMFLTAVDAEKLVPLYLLQVPAQDIDAGVMAQLNGDASISHDRLINLEMPAQVMFDFLANGASDNTQSPVLVAELLDGWPMKHSQTLATFLNGCAHCELRAAVPLPKQGQVQVSDWQQADTQITALFDPQLRQVATTDKMATFVFTDVE